MSDGLQYDYTLIVPGIPKAQGRPRAYRGRKHAGVYDDKKSAKAKESLYWQVKDKAPPEPLRCALQVDIVFCMPRPKSHYGTGRNAGKLKLNKENVYHTSRPDIDNCRKLVMDALTGVFWRDDAQICIGSTTKLYATKPQTNIFIKKLN